MSKSRVSSIPLSKSTSSKSTDLPAISNTPSPKPVSSRPMKVKSVSTRRSLSPRPVSKSKVRLTPSTSERYQLDDDLVPGEDGVSDADVLVAGLAGGSAGSPGSGGPRALSPRSRLPPSLSGVPGIAKSPAPVRKSSKSTKSRRSSRSTRSSKKDVPQSTGTADDDMGTEATVISSEPYMSEEEAVASLTPYQSILDRPDVEVILSSNGYKLVDKVLTTDRGVYVCEYLKAINSRGQPVYIEADSDSYLKTSGNENALNLLSDQSNIPHSVKNGSLECAGTDVCGVVFECQDGVCVVKRCDRTLDPKEVVYANGDTFSYNDGGVPYPVIRMSELESCPGQVSAGVDEATDRLIRSVLDSGAESISALSDPLEKIAQHHYKFYESYCKSYQKLLDTIKQVRDIADNYEKYPPTTREEIEKYKVVKKDLIKRYQLVYHLASMAEELNRRRADIMKLEQDLGQLTDEAERRFTGLDYILS